MVGARSAARAVVRRARAPIAAPRAARQRSPAQGGPVGAMTEDGWDGTLPLALVLEAATAAGRHAALRRLAARALGIAPDGVEIRHEAGRAPRLARPADASIHLSSTSSGGLAAVAVSRQPIGIDLERVDPHAEPPWHVLHPDERRALHDLAIAARAEAFTRIWCGKEAYLKALGLGLFREPAAVRVTLLGGDALRIDDPEADGTVSASATALAWRGDRYRLAAVSIGHEAARWTILVPDHQGCTAQSRTGGHEGDA